MMMGWMASSMLMIFIEWMVPKASVVPRSDDGFIFFNFLMYLDETPSLTNITLNVLIDSVNCKWIKRERTNERRMNKMPCEWGCLFSSPLIWFHFLFALFNLMMKRDASTLLTACKEVNLWVCFSLASCS